MAFALGVVGLTQPVHAQVDDLPLQIHGFVSQGYIKTTHNNYLVDSQRGSFAFSEVGLNLTKNVTENLRVGAQIFARELGPVGNYSPQFDWYYLDYLVRDWLGLRAGRTKLPFGLYNETSDIDAARVPVLLPQSLYPTTSREYLLAQTGGEVYGNVALGGAGQLEYRAYGGTLSFDSANPAGQPGVVSVPYVAGGRLMWSTPLAGLRAGASAQALRLDVDDYVLTPEQVEGLEAQDQLPPDFSGSVSYKLPAQLLVGSLELVRQDLLVAVEYSRWFLAVKDSNLPLLEVEETNERAYAMFSYRLASWFVPGAYYSVLFADPAARDEPGRFQHDVALTARYDIHENWLLKIEGHLMHGTAALSSALNDGVPRPSLTEDWGLLLLKTTGYF